MNPAARAAAEFGDAPSFISPDTRLSWRELASALASALATGPAPAPDSWILPNGPEALLRLFGAWAREQTAAPLNPALPDAETRARWLRDTPLPEGPGTALWTSGSGGAPRAAWHPLSAHLASARGAATNIPFEPGDRWLWSLGHHQVGGLAIAVRAAVGGGAVALDLPLDAVTHISVVAVQLNRLLDRWPRAPRGLKAVLVGGGPIPPGLIDRALSGGWPVHTTWGMTETASQVTTTAKGDGAAALRTAGRVLPERELRIDEDGVIAVRGPVLMRGYLGHPAVHGWFRTGDLGRLDPNGHLTVLGRADLRFVSGGENIHPEEIERVLGDCPGVRQVIVVGVPHPEWGMRPVAFVDGDVGAEVLRAYGRERLPGFKVPDRVLPLAMGEGKVDRVALARRLGEGEG